MEVEFSFKQFVSLFLLILRQLQPAVADTELVLPSPPPGVLSQLPQVQYPSSLEWESLSELFLFPRTPATQFAQPLSPPVERLSTITGASESKTGEGDREGVGKDEVVESLWTEVEGGGKDGGTG